MKPSPGPYPVRVNLEGLFWDCGNEMLLNLGKHASLGAIGGYITIEKDPIANSAIGTPVNL